MTHPVPTAYLAEKTDTIARTIERIRRQDGNATDDDLDAIRFNAELIKAEVERWQGEDQ